jgi:diguanylate cyclase (GGDEF)-like protein
MTMDPLAYTWAAQQLTEYVTALGAYEDVDTAMSAGVERAAEAFEAEAGVVVRDGQVVASIGFRAGEPHDADWAASAPFDDAASAFLALSREDEPFNVEESALLRGMARALAQTVRTLELVGSLRSRQALLERLAHIQRSIVHRTDLESLLDAIVNGARELIGDEVVTLRLLDEHDLTLLRLVAAAGLTNETDRARVRRIPEGADIGAMPLYVIEDGEIADPTLAAEGIRGLMSAPVSRNGVPCGLLTVATRAQGRRYDADERDVLVAFAEHTSLALTDAQNHSDAVHRALHDPLTNLPNRSLFLDRLRQAEQRAARANSVVGVLFVDLDGFKTINDSLGHARGDELLIAVAHRLAESLRAGDTAARLGGDEFAILLDGLTDEREAMTVATRMLEALRAIAPASIGVATSRGPGGDLLRDADLAMYQAKSQGRDRVLSFDCAMLADIAMENDLRRALANDELHLVFQPIVDLETGTPRAAEALLRWGTISPAEFIPLAEETGLIVPIGAWVLEEACRTAADWEGGLPVTVNVSSVQLRAADFANTVATALLASGLPAHRLTIEITETVLMTDVTRTAEPLRALKALGVRIAIDDFGTGHSSLQYLQQLPLDTLKIPKPFIDELDTPEGAGVLARAILELGRSFELQVIAEGIETERQRARLRELGCTRGQGFLFARPMAPEALAGLAAAPIASHVALIHGRPAITS